MNLCHCGAPATANDRECPEHFRARLLSLSIDAANFEQPQGRRNHYDRQSVHDVFGEDAREQMLEETRGLGAIQTARDGSEWVYDDPSTGAMRPLETSDLIGGYLRGPVIDEA